MSVHMTMSSIHVWASVYMLRSLPPTAFMNGHERSWVGLAAVLVYSPEMLCRVPKRVSGLTKIPYYCIAGHLRGDSIFADLRSSFKCEIRSEIIESVLICMAHLYDVGSDPRKSNPQIISVIQLRTLTQKLSPTKNTSCTVHHP